MTMERSNLTNLRSLGEQHVHDWAGARDAIAAGLVEWTRGAVVHDHRTAVRASLAACKLILVHYPQSGGSPRKYIDNMIAVIQRWVDEPTRENQEVVRGALDYTRAVHAWATPTDSIAFWILESVDHACLTVWAGERASYSDQTSLISLFSAGGADNNDLPEEPSYRKIGRAHV